MQRKTGKNLFAVTIAGAVGVAIAAGPGTPPACGTFGWNYSAAYCGPLGGATSVAQCNACCLAAPLTAPQTLDCRAFCGWTTYPPPPSWYDRLVLWLF